MAGLASALPPWLLVTLLLRGTTLLAAPVGEDVHCLTSNVTITPRGRSGESYKVKMQLNGKDITASSCVTKLNASLEEIASETKKPLLEIEQRHNGTSYLISLQCLREANGSINGNLTFGSAEKMYFKLSMKEKHWRLVYPAGRELMEKLSQDKDLNMTYEKILSEYCNALPELVKCEKMETKAPSNLSHESRPGDVKRNSTDVSISVPSNKTASPSLPAHHSSTNWILDKVSFVIGIGIGIGVGIFIGIGIGIVIVILILVYYRGWEALRDMFTMPKTVTSLPMETTLGPLEQINEEREESTTVKL